MKDGQQRADALRQLRVQLDRLTDVERSLKQLTPKPRSIIKLERLALMKGGDPFVSKHSQSE